MAGSMKVILEGPVAAGVTSTANPLIMGGVDGSGNAQEVKVDSSGNIFVSASSFRLPTGAATSALQTTGNTSLASIVSALTNPLPVSATSLPLPTGAATSALQSTGNTSLASIVAALTNPLPVSGSVSVSNFPATQVAVLAAGTAIIGKVGIDQTTPGTTNAVQDASDGPVSAGSAASKSSLGALVAATAAPTPTAGQQIALQGDTSGSLRVSPYGATGSFATKVASGTGAANPSLTVPAGQKWVLVAVTINATIANSGSPRLTALFCQDASSNVFASAVAAVNAPINTLTRFTFAPSLPTAAAIVSQNLSVGYPQVVLGPGMVLNASVVGVSGDSIQMVANVMAFPD